MKNTVRTTLFWVKHILHHGLTSYDTFVIASVSVLSSLLLASPVFAVTRPIILPVQNGVFGDYSLMFQDSAGQYYAGGVVAGQWAWAPQSTTVSDISWGDPGHWPPTSAERFIRSGNWIELDGYSKGQGQPVTEVQRVTSESMGDGACNNMKPLPSDSNRQHYVQWNIPAAGYCLDAKGTITSTTNGSVVHFEHKQQWAPPTPCSNTYVKGKLCISQHEQWWDDNGHPYSLQLDRTQYIAKGVGMGFMINQTYPINWAASMHSYWTW